MDVILECVKILKISRPFKIELLSRESTKFDALYWAHYSEKRQNLTHRIRIYLGNCGRSLEACIAHEFIHAWQEEQGLTEYHGPEFIRMAQKLQYKLSLSGVYCPDTDVLKPEH